MQDFKGRAAEAMKVGSSLRLYKQMDMSDFMDMNLFERLFKKIEDPILRCSNCLCEYCANNVEEIWHKVKPGEMQNPCFNCDECFQYTGESGHRNCDRKDCEKFILSDYGAERNRKTLKIIRAERE